MNRAELEDMANENRNRIIAMETTIPTLATKEQIQQLIAEQIFNRFLLAGVLGAVVINIVITYIRG